MAALIASAGGVFWSLALEGLTTSIALPGGVFVDESELTLIMVSGGVVFFP